KYTRSKLRRALPEQYVFIVEELLYKNNEFKNKKSYYETLVNQVIELKQ
ncbi:fructose-bisphosphatase class III, partial [Staphylococcus aureus]